MATYEDKEEGAFLTSLGAGRSGRLENTVFCFVSPNGQDLLTGAKRGPQQLFRSASEMTKYMQSTAAKYPSQKSASKTTTPLLPKLKDVRLALNVAECDKQPMVVAFGDDQTLKAIDLRLGQVAFNESIRGRFVYAVTHDADDLKKIGIEKDRQGIYVIDPDTFGQKGTELAMLPIDADADAIVAKLSEVVESQSVGSKSHRQHVQAGNRDGIKWETEIPVTDPGSLRAMERGKGRGR